MKKGQKLINTEKKFFLWLVAAAAIHALVLVLAIYLQIWIQADRLNQKLSASVLFLFLGPPAHLKSFLKKREARQRFRPSVKKAVKVKTPAPEKASIEPVKPKVVKKVPVKKEIAVPPKKISIEPVKPKVVDKPADINKALERLKLNVDKKTAQSPQPSASSLNNALAQLQQKVKSESDAAGAGKGSGSGRGSSPAGRSGAGKGYGRTGGTAAPYKAEIASIIMRNWEFSKLLLKNSYGMEVYVRINVLADGTIIKIVFDKRAPSEYLNNSVKKLLKNHLLFQPFRQKRAHRMYGSGLCLLLKASKSNQ